MSFLKGLFSKLSNPGRLLFSLAVGIPVYLLYISGLTVNPPGFFIDESATSYNALNIALNGQNEFGQTLPLYFPVFPLGPPFHFLGYADPIQIYILAALLKIFSPSIFLPRAVSATAMFLAAIVLGLIAKRISGRSGIGIIVGVMGLLTPWLFEIGRVAFSASLYPLMTTLLLLALYTAYRKERWTLLNSVLIALALALTTYTYAVGRLLGPLFAFGLILFATSFRRLGNVFVTWIAYGIALLPMLVFHLRNPAALAGRFNMTVGYIGPGKGYWDSFMEFIPHLMANISLSRYFFNGDPNFRHHVPGAAPILAVTLILALIGILFVVVTKHRKEAWWRFVIYGLIVSVLPASLTREDYHSLRLSAVPVFFIVLTVPLLMWLTGEPKEKSVSRFSWLRVFISKPVRTTALVLILIAGLYQAVNFQMYFRSVGWDRGGYFDFNFPTVFAAAIEQPERPIYLTDQFYYHVFWYAAIQGVDRSNFVKLPPYQRPPANSIVLSGEEKCTDCIMMVKDIPFVVYKTLTEPPSKPEPAPAPAGSTEAPVSKSAGSSPASVAPRGIAVDSQGFIYVADTGNNRIQKFDADGKFLAAFGTPGSASGEIREPNGIAVDSDGNIWVTDAFSHKLVKYNPDGTFANEFRPELGFYGPRDIAIGPNKQLYIVNQGLVRIDRFDPVTEKFTLRWGTRGSGEGELGEPTGIAISGDLVYVADSANDRIQVFDLNGKFVRQWHTFEIGRDNYPDVVFDSQANRFYVTNGKSNLIMSYDTNGNAVDAPKLEGDQRLENPSSLIISEVNKKRRLLILNTASSKIITIELEEQKKTK